MTHSVRSSQEAESEKRDSTYYSQSSGSIYKTVTFRSQIRLLEKIALKIKKLDSSWKLKDGLIKAFILL